MNNDPSVWQPIHVDESIAKKLEGFIGIEECVNYNISTSHVAKRKRTNVKDSRKAKHPKLNQGSNDKWKTKSTCNGPVSPSVCGSTMYKTKDKKEQNESLNVDYVELQAWNVFGLPKSIMCGLQDLKFHEPTQIQSLTLPAAILGKRDILGSSETGSGKTLAFGLPILAGIIEFKNQCTYLDDADMLSADTGSNHTESIASKENSKIKPLYALILTPTRELAIQIKNHLDAVAKYTGINIATIVGGMAAVKQERLLQKGPEIVVATPGRLWELIQQGNSHLSQVDNIKYLAIDETDRMLEKGHFHELHNLLEKINLNKGHKRQNFVFSATLVRASSGNKSRMKFKDMNSTQKMQKIINILGITNPKLVDITSGAGTSSTLTECRISCDMPEKDYYLYYFLKKHPGKTLVFCNSIGCVKRLCNLLNLLECHPLPLHASMPQRQRLKNLERFRDFSNSILIATDVAARGLDIPCVEHVLHYQTPRTSENYIHRSGRTARASEEGITVLFMEPNEVKNYLKICSALEKSKDLPIFPVHESYLKAVKERVNLAREIDKLQLHIRKTNSEVGWIQKMAKNMDIIVAESRMFLLIENYPKSRRGKFSINKNMSETEKKIIGINSAAWEIRNFRNSEYTGSDVNSKDVKLKKRKLASLLSTSIFPQEVKQEYGFNLSPMFSGKLHTEQKAIDIIKNVTNKRKRK